MTLRLPTKVITFRDKEYDLQLLEVAIAKATSTHIAPNSEFDDVRFDESLLPASWAEKYKKPIITMYQGKYVIVYLPEHHKELDLKSGFKAMFLTKYALGQTKLVTVEEVAAVEEYTPPRPSHPRGTVQYVKRKNYGSDTNSHPRRSWNRS